MLLCAIAMALTTTSAWAWTPEPASYGVGSQRDVGVTMKDGTVLWPTSTTRPVPTAGPPPGPFPVIMVQTPYGKDTAGYSSGREGGGESSTELGEVPYLIQRGYIDVIVDVRGTGGSRGSFDLLDPQQGEDGAELVRWAAALRARNGKVGLYGPSYMGLDQFMTAHALARQGGDSPLKALFPIVAGNDVYRDIAFMGGMPGAEFDLAFIGLMTAVETGNPPATHYDDPQALVGDRGRPRRQRPAVPDRPDQGHRDRRRQGLRRDLVEGPHTRTRCSPTSSTSACRPSSSAAGSTSSSAASR